MSSRGVNTVRNALRRHARGETPNKSSWFLRMLMRLPTPMDLWVNFPSGADTLFYCSPDRKAKLKSLVIDGSPMQLAMIRVTSVTCSNVEMMTIERSRSGGYSGAEFAKGLPLPYEFWWCHPGEGVSFRFKNLSFSHMRLLITVTWQYAARSKSDIRSEKRAAHRMNKRHGVSEFDRIAAMKKRYRSGG